MSESTRAEFVGGFWRQPSPAAIEHNWFNVTTWAEQDWKAALFRYWQELYESRNDPAKTAEANARITAARRHYRERVLSWYRELLLPMELGSCVPDRVAELLAEEWDEATR